MPRQVTLERVFLHPVVITPPPPYQRARAWLAGALATLRYGWQAETPDAGLKDWEIVRPNRAAASSS